jgi:hypothetical protein
LDELADLEGQVERVGETGHGSKPYSVRLIGCLSSPPQPPT